MPILHFQCVLSHDGLIVTTPVENLYTCVRDNLSGAILRTFTHTEEDVGQNASVCLSVGKWKYKIFSEGHLSVAGHSQMLPVLFAPWTADDVMRGVLLKIIFL